MPINNSITSLLRPTTSTRLEIVQCWGAQGNVEDQGRYWDDKAVKKMKKPELIDRIGTMIEDSSDTVG